MIGNILVIISVFTYTPLKITPNYFIVSLAMADLTVSACVLPFNIVHSVLGRWVSSLKVDKGQLISELISGVFKFPKKPTKCLTDSYPSFIGQKSAENLVGFFGHLKTPKFHSEIN